VRVLVTGVAGFVGRHLAAACSSAGDEVHGIALTEEVVEGASAVHALDLLDGDALRSLVRAIRPDAVVHLAAVSFVPQAEADPRRAVRVNVEGTVAVLEAVERADPAICVLVVGSSDAYGRVAPDEVPIDETTPLRPTTVYGATKAAAEVCALEWVRRRRGRVVVGRPFNHTGPGQAPEFAVPAFARQVARIRAGRQESVVRVGDLAPVRDVSDVRDVVEAYRALLVDGVPGEVYNVCAGVGTSMREILETLIRLAGVDAQIEIDEALVRPVEVPVVVGSHARLTAATGWRPKIPLVTTLTDVLTEWHQRIGT